MSSLRLEQVCFHYPSGFALHDISLDIPERSFLSVIGPNGSGKTTLLRLMTNLIRPDAGQISLDGKQLSEYGPRQLARQMGVISSEQFFEFPFPAEEVVAMGRYPHLGRFQRMSERDWEIVEEALRRTEASHLRGRSVSQLSSGERQRVLIARAIAQNPSLLMLDEPNAHLDVSHQISIFRLLQSLNQAQGITVIAVLHDLTAAAAFSKSVALFHQGRLIKEGSPEEVITTEILQTTYGAEVYVYPSPLGGFPQVTYAPK